jgi:hypothetical protein
VLQLLVTINAVASSPILVTLLMEEIRSSETPVLTRAALRHIQEDGTIFSHSSENLKFYIWCLSTVPNESPIRESSTTEWFHFSEMIFQ